MLRTAAPFPSCGPCRDDDPSTALEPTNEPRGDIRCCTVDGSAPVKADGDGRKYPSLNNFGTGGRDSVTGKSCGLEAERRGVPGLVPVRASSSPAGSKSDRRNLSASGDAGKSFVVVGVSGSTGSYNNGSTGFRFLQ